MMKLASLISVIGVLHEDFFKKKNLNCSDGEVILKLFLFS